MGLRVTTLEARALELTPEEARARLVRSAERAARAVVEGDLPALGAAFTGVLDWDEQRRFQALRDLARMVMTVDQGRLPWQAAYAEVAHHLTSALEATPAEPVLLNELGVLLYELGENGTALTLFRTAQRLDPELPHVSANVAAARAKGRTRAAPLPPALAVRTRAIAARAKQAAPRAKPATGLTLSLCMIVRDEEEMLPGCLAAVRDAVDEIVVVDTGSTDATVEIARSYGARVVDFPWNGSFADARNVSLEHATGDWIVYLDADEHLVPEDAASLRAVLGRTWREAFYLVETNYVGGDDAGSAVTHLALRVFRNRPEYRFEGRIHEQKTRRMPTYLAERFEATNVRVRHYGYLRSVSTARDKSTRNVELLEVERREGVTPFNSFNLASEYLGLGDAERARALFDEAWELLALQPEWEQVGYAPLLVSRAVKARREAGDRDAALEAVEAGLAAFPDHTDLVFEAALCAHEDGDAARARELAERCLAMGDAPAKYAATVGSGTFLALKLVADIDLASGRTDDAVAAMRRSLADHPEFAGPVLPLASTLLAAGATTAEVDAELPAGKPSVLLLFATALYEAGRAADAEARFRQVLARQPQNGAARVGLVEALLSQRRWGDAVAEAGCEPPESPVASILAIAAVFAHAAGADAAALGPALEQAGELGASPGELAAYEAWRARIEDPHAELRLDPSVAEPVEAALEALLRVQEFEAFATLHGVYEAVPIARRERRERLALIYLRRGYLESAADEWLAVCREQPDVRALVGLAQLAWAQGRGDDAQAFAAEAAALDPDDPVVLRLRAGLERRRAA